MTRALWFCTLFLKTQRFYFGYTRNFSYLCNQIPIKQLNMKTKLKNIMRQLLRSPREFPGSRHGTGFLRHCCLAYGKCRMERKTAPDGQWHQCRHPDAVRAACGTDLLASQGEPLGLRGFGIPVSAVDDAQPGSLSSGHTASASLMCWQPSCSWWARGVWTTAVLPPMPCMW